MSESRTARWSAGRESSASQHLLLKTQSRHCRFNIEGQHKCLVIREKEVIGKGGVHTTRGKCTMKKGKKGNRMNLNNKSTRQSIHLHRQPTHR